MQSSRDSAPSDDYGGSQIQGSTPAQSLEKCCLQQLFTLEGAPERGKRLPDFRHVLNQGFHVGLCLGMRIYICPSRPLVKAGEAGKGASESSQQSSLTPCWILTENGFRATTPNQEGKCHPLLPLPTRAPGGREQGIGSNKTRGTLTSLRGRSKGQRLQEGTKPATATTKGTFQLHIKE